MALRPYRIMAPSHRGLTTLQPHGIAAPSHRGPIALRPHSITAPSHCGPTASRPHGIAAPSHHDPIASRPQGIAAPRHRSPVASQSHRIAASLHCGPQQHGPPTALRFYGPVTLWVHCRPRPIGSCAEVARVGCRLLVVVMCVVMCADTRVGMCVDCLWTCV